MKRNYLIPERTIINCILRSLEQMPMWAEAPWDDKDLDAVVTALNWSSQGSQLFMFISALQINA
jgi:hypothetical protein